MFDNPEEGLIKSHQPCPCGNSSDAFAYYENGGHCFSGKCEGGKNFYTNHELGIEEGKIPDMNMMFPVATKQTTPKELSSGVLSDIPDRKINKETCKHFGVTLKHDDTVHFKS